MSKKNTGGGSLEKEEVLRAVLIAQDFEDVFTPFLSSGASVFLSLGNRKILDYSLEWLSQSGIQETILFCSNNAEAVKEYVKSSGWGAEGRAMKIVVMLSESCMSVGDALRDIDNKGIIKSDFVLLSTSTIASFSLQDVLKLHKSRCKEDRGTAMTMILHDRGCLKRGRETITALTADSSRLLVYAKKCGDKKIQLPMEVVHEHTNITLSSTLQDTGVAICSPSVPLLFSDNFDFQSKEDFIRGLLMNEEVLASRIYCHVTDKYGHTVEDWPTYLRTALDVARGWSFPLVPNVGFGPVAKLVQSRNCIYKHPSVHLPLGCKLVSDVVIGDGCTIGKNVFLQRSFIGVGCKIEDGASITDSVIFDNATISSQCTLSFVVVGDNVKIGGNSKLHNCQIHHSAQLGKSLTLSEKVIASNASSETTEKVGDAAYVVSKCNSDSESDGEDGGDGVTWLLDDQPGATSDADCDTETASESDASRSASPEQDDCTQFYTEVVESLQRGYEEKLPCSNLILEVNSSRYAYNVTLSEVTQLTCKAVLTLPHRLQCPAKPLLVYFKPLFTNYVKNESGQMECLSAFEDVYDGLGGELINCLHFLYNADILDEDVVLKWHDELDDDLLKSRLEKFITWLQQDNDSDEEEDD